MYSIKVGMISIFAGLRSLHLRSGMCKLFGMNCGLEKVQSKGVGGQEEKRRYTFREEREG